MGLTRNIYWGFHLSDLHGEEIEAGEPSAINCEWLTFPVRRATELAGLSLDDCSLPSFVEFSIYQDSHHHPVQLGTLFIDAGTSDGEFTIRTALHSSDVAAGPLEIEGIVQFDGAILVPQSFEPAPRTPKDAASLVAPYLDLDALEPPVWDRFRYLLKPRIG